MLDGAKTPHFYAGVLGALRAGRPFTVLLGRTPAARRHEMLARLPRYLLAPEESLRAVRAGDVSLPVPSPSTVAYTLFTSGSSGQPKAISVSQANLAAYLEATIAIVEPSPRDRVSQLFETGFDPAISDLLWAFGGGACLCPLESLNIRSLGAYLMRERITVFSVSPSLLRLALRAEAFPPDARYPAIRFSMFTGERLDWDLAEAWARLAPESVLENHYGATELTINVARYRLPRPPIAAEPSVPVGQPFPGHRLELIDDEGRLAGGEGEAVVQGPQVTAGYLGQPEQTSRAFMPMHWDKSGETWYRTGDRLRRLSDGKFLFLGRGDGQLKVRGVRIEMNEVWLRLREACPAARVLAILPRPGGTEPGRPVEHLAVVVQNALGVEELARTRALLAEQLPAPAVPLEWYLAEEPPLSPNGKADTQALARAVNESGLTRLWPR